ncbi:MAG: hypothetical protein M1335_05365 [Chloroflexi bacterium]|nr:hypothetical protein [Chloroflexota bacterium]
MTMEYVESLAAGTIRYGKNPRNDSAKSYGDLEFLKDGVHYGIGGTNMHLDELTKIAESMLD